MMNKDLVSSLKMANIMRIDAGSEPDAAQMTAASKKGIYLGPGKIYGTPIFLDFERLINPHIFVTGITGAGKTYLARNLMLKLYGILDAAVVLVDFTGEYREFAEAAGCKIENSHAAFSLDESGIVYVGLKGMREKDKIGKALKLLDRVAVSMRARSASGKNRRLFVILDEAWKLMRESSSFETIIREGRKYGVGMVLATQLLEDINATFLSNIATVFIFRVQNDASLDRIAGNYGLTGKQVEEIKNLEVGSCLLVQLHKGGVRSFCIRKIRGIRVPKIIAIRIGDRMDIETSMDAFSKLVEELCGGNGSEQIISAAREAGYVKLDELVSQLVLHGASRKEMLRALRKTGIADADIADAFAFAILHMGIGDDRR